MGRARGRATLLAALLLTLAVGLGAPPARASPYHMMEANASCGSLGCTFDTLDSTTMAAQSFIAQDGYNLTRVGLNLSLASVTSPTPITLALASDAGGIPGTTLATTTASTSSLLPVWVNFTLASPVPLLKGNRYWLVASNPGPSAYRWVLSGGDTYPPGTSATKGGSGWVVDPRDLFFRNYGYLEARMALAKTVDKARAQVGNNLTYRLYFNNTGTEAAPKAWVNDSLPAAVTYVQDNAAAAGGVAVAPGSWVFTSVGPGTHAFDIVVRVNAVAPGTLVINTAHLDYRNTTGVAQPGSSAQAATLVGIRTKSLYLHEGTSADTLDTQAPTSPVNCNAAGSPCDYDNDGIRGLTIKRGSSHDWSLAPPLAENFTILGPVSWTLWLDDRAHGETEQITVTLYQNTTARLLASSTYSMKLDSVNGFQAFSNTLPMATTTLVRGSTLLLRLAVPTGSANDLQLAYDTTVPGVGPQPFQSGLQLDTPTYIHITAMASLDARGATSNFVPSENLTLFLTVADPLGAYDIVIQGHPTVDLLDSQGRTVLGGAVLNLASMDPSTPAAWRSFSLTTQLPSNPSQGTFTAKFTALESNLVPATGSLTFDVRGPVFSPTMAGPGGVVHPGDRVQYVLYFNNSGLVVAPQVWVNDSLPQALANASDNASAAGGVALGNGSWRFPNVTPGAHWFLLNATVGSGIPGSTTVINQANLTFSDQKGYLHRVPGGRAAFTVAGPSLAVGEVASTPFVARGEVLNFTVYVNDTGNDASGRVWVNVTVPGNATFSGDDAPGLPGFTSEFYDGAVLRVNVTNLTVGVHAFNVTVQPRSDLPGGAALDSTVAVAYLDGAGIPVGPVTARAVAYISAPRVALRLDLQAPRHDPGSPVDLTLILNNTGPGVTTARNALLTMTLGVHVNLVLAIPQGTYDSVNHTVVWLLPLVYVGQVTTFRLNATVVPGTPDRTNVSVQVTATFQDEFNNPMPPTQTAPLGFAVTAPVVDLVLRSPTSAVLSGDIMNYTLAFNNTGTGRAGHVWINATLNPATAILTVTVNALGTLTVLPPRLGNRVAMAFTDLGPGDYLATLQVEIRAGLRDNLTVTNGATLDHTDGNGNQGPRLSATASVTVWAPAVTVAMTSNATAVVQGQGVNFTYAVANVGHATALGVWLNLTLDPDLELVAWGGQGEAIGTPRQPSWRFPSLAAGETRSVYILLRVSPTAPADEVVVQGAVVTYTDALGLQSSQLDPGSLSLRVLGRPSALLQWYYFLPLLAFVPVVVHHRRRLPRIHEVFVVYKDGSLIAHRSRTRTSDKDEDVLMAMFTAIQDFIRESFSYGSTRELKRMDLGEYSVEICRGERLYLAVIHQGKATPALTPTLEALVERMERDHATVLRDWDGDMAEVGALAHEVACLFPRHVRRHLDRAPRASQPR